MTSDIDIYEVLTSKQHNPHYVQRYLAFIEMCMEHNENLDENHYMEAHHILPKASDMFSEYIDFNEHRWNRVYLTARQHFTAHLILWRAYPNTASQCAAIHYMCNVQNSDKCSISGRVIPQAFKNRYAAKAREEFFLSRRGFANYLDEAGTLYNLHRDDPKIVELGLFGARRGIPHTKETQRKMRSAKYPKKRVWLYFLDMMIRVSLFSEQFSLLIEQGWVTHRLEEDYAYIKQLQYEKNSASLKGRADYMYADGTYYGKIRNDDPIIEELGLTYHRTEARAESARNANKFAIIANTGTTWYNNGVETRKFKEHPGEPWVEGVLYDDVEAVRIARADGVRKAISGKVTYNDGKTNRFFSVDEEIPAGWVRGMKPQKKRKSSANLGCKVYNDGIKQYRVKDGDYVDPSWMLGMVPKKKKDPKVL